jgi:hypothetical protein
MLLAECSLQAELTAFKTKRRQEKRRLEQLRQQARRQEKIANEARRLEKLRQKNERIRERELQWESQVEQSRKQLIERELLDGLMKSCGHCCKELPANEDFFDRDQSKPDGLRNWCKECRKNKGEINRLKAAAEVIDALDKSILTNLAQSKSGGSNVPHVAQLCEAYVSILGGVNGVAQHFAGTFLAAKPGSQTRERMLTGLQKMIIVLSDSNKVSMPDDYMSDDDFEKAMAERDARRDARIAKLKVVDGVADEVQESELSYEPAT